MIIFYIIFCVLAVAMITAAETALTHVPGSQLTSLIKRDRRASIVRELADAVHLLPVLRGVNILLTISLALACQYFLKSRPTFGVDHAALDAFINTFVLAALLLVFSVFIPYVAARNYPLEISLFFAMPVVILYRLAKPITKLFDWMTGHVLRDMVGLDTDHAQEGLDIAELGLLIKRAGLSGALSGLETEMALNSIKLSERRIGSMMTPRTSLCAIDITDSPDIVRDKMMQSPHSRYPLINGTLENVVGIVRLMDLIRFVLAPDHERPSLESISSGHLLVPDSTNALSLLETFKDNPSNLAVAFDEYGNITGVVTLYDLLETLAGGITHTTDDRDMTPADIVERQDGSFFIDGSMAVEDFFEAFGMEEHLEELTAVGAAYTTVAGFILANIGHIPKVGEIIDIDHLQIEILDLDGSRIDKVLVTKMQPPPDPTEDQAE